MSHCELCDTEVKDLTTCPRSVPCPDCGAQPGSPCKRPSGHRAAALHMSRVRDAEAIDYKIGVGPDPATIVT